jgi:hypothetical protein
MSSKQAHKRGIAVLRINLKPAVSLIFHNTSFTFLSEHETQNLRCAKFWSIRISSSTESDATLSTASLLRICISATLENQRTQATGFTTLPISQSIMTNDGIDFCGQNWNATSTREETHHSPFHFLFYFFFMNKRPFHFFAPPFASGNCV